MDTTSRIGYGEDSHRLVEGRELIVGGVRVEGSPLGPEAHSDGDVLLHALADALLSAFALGDIGRYFPPSDPHWSGIPGRDIVAAVLERVELAAGSFRLHNVAAVVTLDRPKLGPYREAMERNVGLLLGLEPGRVGIGFKTSEGAATGHIQARVTVLISTDGN